MSSKIRAYALVNMLIFGLLSSSLVAAENMSAQEIRNLAKQAYIYGYPIVDNYRILYTYAVNKSDPEFKGPMNQVHSTARVFTPEDKTVQTPNSDTPYSMAILDLRAEPIVVTLPPIEKNRYYSVQMIDLYTFNFDYLGTRSTGNGGGNFLIAGPGWKGETPKGIKKVSRAETDLALLVYRTQLFNNADLKNVEKIQAGYKMEPLSVYSKSPAPSQPPPLDFIKPLSVAEEKKSLEFFNILNFALALSPVDPSEVELRRSFEKIGIKPGSKIEVAKLSPMMEAAMKQGMVDGQDEIKSALGSVSSSADWFGTRQFLKNNYLFRAAAAQLGIYGNSKDEAMYFSYQLDSEKEPLDGSKHNYLLRFEPGQLPPTDAFWSLTMYNLPEQLLIANPLHRYLINSTMLPSLKKDPDGGWTIYIQAEPPEAGKESNWLPAPKSPFFVVLRDYLPKPEVLDGRWKKPIIQQVK